MIDDMTPPGIVPPTSLPTEKMEEAIDVLISFMGEGDNYFTRAASEKSIQAFIHGTRECEPMAFAEILTMNVSLMNTVFQKSLLGALRSQTRSLSIADAVRAQNQIVRSIDAWRRLKDFENRQTK